MPKGCLQVSEHRKDDMCNSQFQCSLSSSNVKSVLAFRLNFYFYDFPGVTELKETRGRRHFAAVSCCPILGNNFQTSFPSTHLSESHVMRPLSEIYVSVFRDSTTSTFLEMSFDLCHKVEVICNSKCQFI